MIYYRPLGKPPAWVSLDRKHLAMGTFLYRTGLCSLFMLLSNLKSVCSETHRWKQAADANCSWLHSPRDSTEGAGNRLAVCSPMFLFPQCPSMTHLDHTLVKAGGLSGYEWTLTSVTSDLDHSPLLRTSL